MHCAAKIYHPDFITGRLPWQPAGIKFTQIISIFAPVRKNYALDRKMNGIFRIASTLSTACKVWGEIELRAPAVAKIIFVCHAWSACAWVT